MSLTLILTTLFTLLIGYLIIRIYLHFTFWQRQGVESHKFVTLEWALKPFHEFIMDNSRRFGKVYGGYNVGSKILIVNDPKLARELSIKEAHKFPVRITFHLGTSNINSALFFLTANEDWKRIRSIVTPAFTSGKLKAMLSPIEKIVHNFINHIHKYSQTGELFDIKKHTSGFAMDVIASCAYGIEIDSINEPNHPLVANAKQILGVDASVNFIICVMFPTIAKFFGLEAFNKKSIKFFDDLTSQIIEERLKAYKNQQNRDLIGLMMENQQEHCIENGENLSNGSKKLKGISKGEISGQGILFFIAGFDTTNTTFCHIIYYLTKNPEWQERLFNELMQVKSKLDYETLRELPILNAVIDETLRLCPPLVVFQRGCTEDTTLLDTGIKIPKDSLISIQPYVIHRNPEYFPDPESFKPERFLDKKESSESNFAYMPFGVGPRLCVGMRFAQNELRIGIANFVLKYKLEHNSDLKLDYFKGSVLMTPKDVMVRISAR